MENCFVVALLAELAAEAASQHNSMIGILSLCLNPDGPNEGHTSIGHDYIGLNFIGHGHIGHDYMDHNYMVMTIQTIAV